MTVFVCMHAQLQSEYDKLQPKPMRTIRDRERIAQIESRLTVIGKEASQLRIKLKNATHY